MTMSLRLSTPTQQRKKKEHESLELDDLTEETRSDDGAQDAEAQHPAATSIFVRRSVNLISCGSNAGKTTFCKNVLLNRDVFFERGSVDKIIYVNCNSTHHRTHFENPYEEDSERLPPLEAYSLQEIEDVSSILDKNSVVILDDVLTLDETINYLIAYAANHLDCIIFVITQSCLSSPLFTLIYKVHNLVLFFKNSSSIRLSHYLLSHFFISADTKKYLRDIFAKAEEQKSIVSLKLNAVASSSPNYQKILAFANLQQLLDPKQPFCWAYPELGHVEELSESLLQMDYTTVDGNQFVLAQAKFLQFPNASSGAASEGNTICAKKRKWEEMNAQLKDEIHSVFPSKRWKAAINLCREILRIEDFCISEDYRRLVLKAHKKKANISIVDFLGLATRRSFPGEELEKYAPYVPFVKIMIKRQMPLSLLVNRKLLEAAHIRAK